jgi:glucokinase
LLKDFWENKMKKALAFDIGGTKIYSTLINEQGEIVSEIKKFSTPKSLDGIREVLSTRIAECESEVDIIAIATAGAVNNSNSAVIGSTGNLVEGYSSIDFSSLSKKRVFLENDANSAAWAEYKIGASQNTQVSVLLTLGTGVGGGIIINDRLLKGKSGAAGEMHFKMYSDKRRKCTCGSWDCFEIYASGTALKLDAEEELNDKSVTTYDVINGVNNNNSRMIKILTRWQDDITIGIKGLVNIFDPDCIVLSGSMAQFVDTKQIEQEVNSDIVTTPTSIRLATAGNYSGMIGVALLALERGL